MSLPEAQFLRILEELIVFSQEDDGGSFYSDFRNELAARINSGKLGIQTERDLYFIELHTRLVSQEIVAQETVKLPSSNKNFYKEKVWANSDHQSSLAKEFKALSGLEKILLVIELLGIFSALINMFKKKKKKRY